MNEADRLFLKNLQDAGLGGPSEAAKRPNMLNKAYEMGKAL